jgi:putative peptidoglycan lipid II flippase
MELTTGVFAIAIAQGAFSSMNEAAQRGDLEGLKRIWRFSFDLSNLIAIPAAIGLAVLAEPIIAVLFLHGRFGWDDVRQTALNVTTASFGLVFSASVRGTLQIFYALEDRRTPVVVSVVVVVVNFVLGASMVRAGVGVHGLSLTLSISTGVQALLLALLARRRVGDLGAGPLALAAAKKTAVAAVACAAAAAVARGGEWTAGVTVRNVVTLAAAIGVAVALYGLAAVRLQLGGADQLAGRVLRRRRRQTPTPQG